MNSLPERPAPSSWWDETLAMAGLNYRQMGWEQVDNGDGTFSYRAIDKR